MVLKGCTTIHPSIPPIPAVIKVILGGIGLTPDAEVKYKSW